MKQKFTRYYECHITLNESDPEQIQDLENALNRVEWRFSKIDGDPVLGKGIKCYGTRHYNYNLNKPDAIIQTVENCGMWLKSIGYNVVRTKVEIVIYDNKLV